MDYADAIKYLKEHDIKKDDGTYYEFGEVGLKVAIPRYWIYVYNMVYGSFLGYPWNARKENDRPD